MQICQAAVSAINTQGNAALESLPGIYGNTLGRMITMFDGPGACTHERMEVWETQVCAFLWVGGHL